MNITPKTTITPIKAVKENAFLKEFKEFINRGNVVDLAIGVAVGGAFTTIVNSLVNDIIMPVSSLLAGGCDFRSMALDIPNLFGANTTAHIAYGNFIQNVINFLLIALTVFVIVRTLNRLNRQKDAAAKKAAEQKAAAKADTEKNTEKKAK